MTEDEVMEIIGRLSPEEKRRLLTWLFKDLEDEGEGGAGVREPRWPVPFSPVIATEVEWEEK